MADRIISLRPAVAVCGGIVVVLDGIAGARGVLATGDADRGRPTGDVGKSAGPARAVAYGGRERRGQA